MRCRSNDCVEPMAVGFVAVQREVLESRDDALALNAVDGFRGYYCAHPRILGIVFKVPAIADITREVDSACQHDVEASHARLAANCGAAIARELRIEARADHDGCRERSCALDACVASTG